MNPTIMTPPTPAFTPPVYVGNPRQISGGTTTSNSAMLNDLFDALNQGSQWGMTIGTGGLGFILIGSLLATLVSGASK